MSEREATPPDAPTQAEKNSSLPPIVRNDLEQDRPEMMDEIVATCGDQMLPVVGEARSVKSSQKLESLKEQLSTVNAELKRKLDELRDANADLTHLIAATGVVTLFLDRELHIMRYTPGAVALFHLTANDVSRPFGDLQHQLNYPELNADAERVLETLIPVKRKVSGGEGHWYLARLLPYRTAEDRVAGVVLTFVDITETPQAERALEEHRGQLEAVLRYLPIGVILSEAPSGKCLFHNEEATRLVGYALPMESYHEFERLGALRGDGSCCAVEDYPATRALLHGESVDQEEVTHRRPDGSTMRLAVSSAAIRGESGEIVSAVTALIDIEARRTAEDALRGAEAKLAASQERLRLIVENAREYAIFSLDLDRKVTSWNSGAVRLLQFTEREIVGQSADVIFTAEDRADGAPESEARLALTDGRAADERWHVRKDGSVFWGSGVMMAMRDTHGHAIGFVKIFRDETAARAAKQEIEQSREKLWNALQETERARAEAEAAGRAKDHFLAVLSHELRTPLTPVLMAVHALSRRKDLPEAVTEALDMIRRNVQLEAHFVDDLLDVTRITRGKLELVRDEMDVHEAIRHALEISAPDMRSREQEFVLDLGASEHRLIGDTRRLQQVFWNLVKNASKFTPSGGRITVCTRSIGERMIVTVSDTGVGFEPEAAARIFNPFVQASAEVTREFGGLGLGLAISRATVEAHGGTIRAESAGRGKGATFTVELPLVQEDDARSVGSLPDTAQRAP